MNESKICFITCVNNEFVYEECLRYIHSLDVSEGITVEIIAIRDAHNMAEGYNRAMNQSDARYKIYMQQEAFVINKHFIHEAIDLFKRNPQLGMMGMIGARKLPPSGVWWLADEKYGKIYCDKDQNGLQLVEEKEVLHDYEKVDAIDGLAICTQYDIPWREDLFTTEYMYDIAQAMEFKRAGYDVGIPPQKQCWFIQDSNPINNELYEQQRKVFVNEYYAQFQPLVSILIPTYNRVGFLEQAVQSVLSQTYRNIELIISDDSTNPESQQMIKPYSATDHRIHYIKNPERLEMKNAQHCLDLAQGVFIGFLMDDDLFAPGKVEKMVASFLKYPEVSLVTSYRKLIDENNNILEDGRYNQQIVKEDTLLDGIELGDIVLKNRNNLIGEPTTVMFKKVDLETLGEFRGRKFTMINDLASWLVLLNKGKTLYIAEPLSYFRQHSGQNQNNLRYMYKSIPDWFEMIEASREVGFLQNSKDYQEAISNYIRVTLWIIQTYKDQSQSHKLIEADASGYLKKAIEIYVQ